MGSIWDGVEDAEIFDRGNYLKANFLGQVEITKTLVKNTRSVGPAFIVEMKIAETNMEDVHPVGQSVTWFQKMTDKDIAFPAIAEWAAACVGINPRDKEKVKAEVMPELKTTMEEATDSPEDNAFIGAMVGLETVAHTTKNDRQFTRHNWMPL